MGGRDEFSTGKTRPMASSPKAVSASDPLVVIPQCMLLRTQRSSCNQSHGGVRSDAQPNILIGLSVSVRSRRAESSYARGRPHSREGQGLKGLRLQQVDVGLLARQGHRRGGRRVPHATTKAAVDGHVVILHVRVALLLEFSR